jgi:opacity protein-like surface antigen
MDCDYRLATLNINLKGEKMKVHTRRFLTIIILGLFVFVMTSEVCNAQYSRSGKSEIYGMIQTMSGNTSDFSSSTYTIENSGEFDDSTVFGFGIGSNFTDHWNVNMDLLFGSSDFTRIRQRPGYSSTSVGDCDLFFWDINVEYNVFADRLTPLVTGGIGLANFSIGSLISETDFTYNLGAGGRWDITDNIFVKALYRITWTELEDAKSNVDFDGICLSVGYMF